MPYSRVLQSAAPATHPPAGAGTVLSAAAAAAANAVAAVAERVPGQMRTGVAEPARALHLWPALRLQLRPECSRTPSATVQQRSLAGTPRRAPPPISAPFRAT